LGATESVLEESRLLSLSLSAFVRLTNEGQNDAESVQNSNREKSSTAYREIVNARSLSAITRFRGISFGSHRNPAYATLNPILKPRDKARNPLIPQSEL
jgi:hypothetical protein